jgi:hypothetical protein
VGADAEACATQARTAQTNTRAATDVDLNVLERMELSPSKDDIDKKQKAAFLRPAGILTQP